MSVLSEQVQQLREELFGVSFMGGASYPGPEPGKVFGLGVAFPGGEQDVSSPVNGLKPKRRRIRRSGREREEPRWREP